MARWQITFEIDLPTESYNKAAQWAEYRIGWHSELPLDNPCADVDIPAQDEYKVSMPRVHRVL